MENNEKVVNVQPEVKPQNSAETVKSENTTNEVKQPAAPNGNSGDKKFRKTFSGPRKSFSRGPKPQEYEEIVVNINRVTKVVKGGKRMKFQALVVVGDKKGKYGYGIGKSGEVPDAIKKAVEAAKKNMFKLNIVKGDTIAHDIIGNFGATSVFLKPAKEGTGIVAGGPVRNILELAGIKNVYSKVHGSRTAINIIRATDDALRNLKSYSHVQELRNK